VATDRPSGTCPDCQNGFGYLLECLDGVARCYDCRRAFDQAQQRRGQGAILLGKLDAVVTGELRRAGMSDREIRSSVDGTTRTVWEALRIAQELAKGHIPTRGLGLSGPPGVGKTGALAALMGRCMRARLERTLPEAGASALSPWLLWCSWPEAVNRMRVGSTRDGGIQDTEEFIEQAIAIEVLVLDDLGAERIRGSYVDDWAASQLDLVIDGRYRNDRRTWFTTGLEPGELMTKYGRRLTSRLLGDNDLVEVTRSGDRRIEGR
jgi:DNA replication protein DnaC